MVNDKLKFTKGEERLMKYFTDNKGEDITIDELANHFYKGKKKPSNPRGSIAALMRYMTTKCLALGVTAPERVTGLGRGVVAVYRMSKSS